MNVYIIPIIRWTILLNCFRFSSSNFGITCASKRPSMILSWYDWHQLDYDGRLLYTTVSNLTAPLWMRMNKWDNQLILFTLQKELEHRFYSSKRPAWSQQSLVIGDSLKTWMIIIILYVEDVHLWLNPCTSSTYNNDRHPLQSEEIAMVWSIGSRSLTLR